jgi:hypothetical protein
MPSLNLEALTSSMVDAAGGVLKDHWKKARPYAEEELRKIAEAVGFIQDEVLAGRMSVNKARMHLEMQKDTATTVLLTVQGLNLIAVEQAINAALDVIKDTVNGALRFPLL